MLRYFIINPYSLEPTEQEVTKWFKTPIDTHGKSNQLMCYFDTIGGYHAKRTWASSTHYYVKFFEFGENKEFSLKGWKFPKEIKNAKDYSSNEGRMHNEFSFICTTPYGKKCSVNAHIDTPFIWGIMKVIKTLVFNDELFLMKYGTVNNEGNYRILFRSYYDSGRLYYSI